MLVPSSSTGHLHRLPPGRDAGDRAGAELDSSPTSDLERKNNQESELVELRCGDTDFQLGVFETERGLTPRAVLELLSATVLAPAERSARGRLRAS